MQCRILIWKSNTGTEHGGYSHTSVGHLGCNKACLPFALSLPRDAGPGSSRSRCQHLALPTTTWNDQNEVNNTRPSYGQSASWAVPQATIWATAWYLGHHMVHGPLRSMRATTWYKGHYRLHGSLDNHMRGSITGTDCDVRLAQTHT